MKKLCAISVALVSLFTLSACGQSGPVVLALSSSQLDSGENRATGESSSSAPSFKGMAVDYQIVGDLPSLPTQGQAWSVSNFGEAMRETQRLADSLEINAKAKRSDDDKYVFIAQDPKTKASVWLWNHLAIGGWWSYTQANSSTATSTPSCPPDDRRCLANTEQQAPTNLIPEDEAIARTSDYLTKAKITTADYVFTSLRSEWSTEVTGTLQVDNVQTNLAANFSFGQDGELMYASGPMVTLTKADLYPLISVEEALKRLSMPQYGFYGVAASRAFDVAVSDSGEPNDSIVPLTIPVTDVRFMLMESNLSNGTHMLLPAYTFSNADGDVGTTMAVTDEFMVFPKLEIPLEPSPGVPEPGVIEPINPGPGTKDPDTEVENLTQAVVDSLIGLTEDEASKIAQERGWMIRVAMRDGEAFMLTTDYRQDRVNVVIVKTLVTAVQIG